MRLETSRSLTLPVTRNDTSLTLGGEEGGGGYQRALNGNL